MSGLEVLKFLRRVDSLIDLPIIMVTAKGESEDMVEALELGANDYVTKPLDFPVVLARIRTQLALRRAASQVTELEQNLDARNKELAEAQLYRYDAEGEGRTEGPLSEHNHALDALRYLVATLDAHHLARPRLRQPEDAPPESSAPGAAARRPARDPWLRLDNDALWTRLT
jgi:DNA-binding response OmpR family regulator